jgi:hypothetical protein
MRRLLVLACFLASASLGALSACDNGTEAAGECGDQECPVGTAFYQSANSMLSYDISLGFNPATYEADGAFASFGSGSCEYYCSVIAPCPDGTFPVITADCFTCGIIDYDNEGNPTVQQGDCSGGAGTETGG